MTTADTTSSSSASTTSSSSLLHSLENGTLLSNNGNNSTKDEEESSLRNDIQRTLSTLAELIQSKLSPAAEVSGKSQHLLLVKRYREILFDLTSDFQKTSAQLQRKKQQAELFAGANRHNNKNMGSEHDAATEHLLRERNHIGNSLAASSQIIAQATEIHSDLRTQGASLRGVTGTLVKIGSQVPGLNRLMENIRRKKGRDDMIVSAVIALCIVFTLWYLFG